MKLLLKILIKVFQLLIDPNISIANDGINYFIIIFKYEYIEKKVSRIWPKSCHWNSQSLWNLQALQIHHQQTSQTHE